MTTAATTPSFARLFLILVIAVLLIATARNLTRTDGLAAALEANRRGDLLGAVQASLDVLHRRPWDREATRLTAELFSKLDYANVAEPYYQRLGLDSLAPDTLHARAYGIVRSNQRQKAIAAYEAILDRDPNDTLALRRLAGVQMTQSNDDEVLKLADRLIRIPEGVVYGYTLRGVVELNQRNREDSVAAFEKVMELDPDLKIMPLPRRIFWGHFGYDLLDLGRGADFRRYLGDTADRTADPYLMNALGRSYYLEGDLDSAEQCYQKSAEWDASDPIPRLYLGKIQIHRRRQESALTFLEEAIKIAPKHYDSLYTLAMTYRQLGRTDEALKLQPRINEIRDASLSNPSTTTRKAPPPRYAL